MPKSIVLAVLAFSVALNLLLVYNTIDLGVTNTHCKDRVAQRDKQLRAMQALFPLLVDNKTNEDLRNAAKTTGLELVEKRPTELWIAEIEFRSSNDQIKSINFN